MGVRGLKTFFERERQTRPINIGTEVTTWKRQHPNQTPLLVIDFMSVVNNRCNFKDVVCGERHRNQILKYDGIFAQLASLGCKLVFYSDLNVQPEKVPMWLKRRLADVEYYTELYDDIAAGQTLDDILAQVKDPKSMPAIFYTVMTVARKYGEFRYCQKHECDLEVARYATEHGAMAVVSNDTDFLIYEGSWRFWTIDNLTGGLNATEFDRYGIARLFGISAEQRPLFATLIGNDFTNTLYNILSQFHSSLGPWQRKFYNVAAFVRQQKPLKMTTNDFKLLARRVFGDEDMHTLLQESIESYGLKYAVEPLDPIAAEMAGTRMERFYLDMTGLIQTINLPFCDLRGSTGNLSMVLLDFIKRGVGVLKQHTNDKSFKFITVMRKHVDEMYGTNDEEPIYPDFKMLPLRQLYFGAGSEIDQMRWKTFAWIVSLEPGVIEKVKATPKAHRLVVAVLCVLCKNHLVDVKQADGILLTEYKSSKGDPDVSSSQPPQKVNEHSIRSAHIYSIGFSRVRESAFIAGLANEFEDVSQFDGVYYQNLMNNTSNDNIVSRINAVAMTPCRIYAE